VASLVNKVGVHLKLHFSGIQLQISGREDCHGLPKHLIWVGVIWPLGRISSKLNVYVNDCCYCTVCWMKINLNPYVTVNLAWR